VTYIVNPQSNNSQNRINVIDTNSANLNLAEGL